MLKHLSKLTLHLWTFYVIFLVSLRCSSLCHLPAVLWLASHSVVFPEIIWVHPDALQHKTTNADPQIAALWFISAWSGMFHSSSWGSGSCYCPGFEDCSEVSCSVEIWAVPLALLFSPTQPPSTQSIPAPVPCTCLSSPQWHFLFCSPWPGSQGKLPRGKSSYMLALGITMLYYMLY